MKLLLMRHGEAELNAQTDADRPLTLYGRTQVSAVARRLLEMDLQVQKNDGEPVFARTADRRDYVQYHAQQHVGYYICEVVRGPGVE